MAAAGGGSGLHKLTRQHGIKLCPAVDCSMEEVSLAVGEVVGCECVKSASRMNSAVVVFVDSVAKANLLMERGVVIKGSFTPVMSLANPVKKILISNVPPFLNNDLLERELARHGQVMSPIKLIPIYCKSPQLKHVLSFRRSVFMVLKKSNEELNLVFSFKIDEFIYKVHVTSGNMKCFGCGKEGHVIRVCPDRAGESQSAASAPAPPPALDGDGSAASAPAPPSASAGDSAAPAPAPPPAGGGAEAPVPREPQSDTPGTHTDTRGAEGELSEEEDFLMEEELKKLSTKRKNPENKTDNDQGKKMSKVYIPLSDSQVEAKMTEIMKATGGDGYPCSFEGIQQFLHDTKGMRMVNVDDFFLDPRQFMEVAKGLMGKSEGIGQPTFSDQEVYRLRKLLSKTRALLAHEERLEKLSLVTPSTMTGKIM